MNALKRIWALAVCLVMAVTCLTACGDEAQSFNLSVALGDRYETLDPIYAESAVDRSIIAHLYENLMKLSADAEGNTSAGYGLAKSVEQETNVDGTVTYTFRLRSAKWSDGQAITADDFVYAWQRLADPANDSPHARLLSVVCGYDAARDSGDMSLLQVTAKNDTTLVVNLSGDYTWFLEDVCTDPATVPLRRSLVPTAVKDSAEAVEVAADAEAWWSDIKKMVVSAKAPSTSASPRTSAIITTARTPAPTASSSASWIRRRRAWSAMKRARWTWCGPSR